MVILQTAIHWAPSLFGLLRQLPQEAQARLGQTIASQQINTDNESKSIEDNQSKGKSSTSHQAQSTEYLVHNWLDAVFAWLQVVVLWHEPLVSLHAIIGIITTFLTLTYFAPSFYATVAIAFFIYNLIVVWFRHIWPEIRIPPDNEEAKILDVDRWTYLHPQLMTLSELKHLLNDIMHIIVKHFYEDASKLRQREPVKFCLTVCTFFSVSSYVGNQISGLNLLFIVISILVASPGIYLYLLPKKLKSSLSDCCISYVDNCEYCIEKLITKQHQNHNLDQARAHQQQHHYQNQQMQQNHIITSISESLFHNCKQTASIAAQNEEVVSPSSKALTIDQLMSYITRGPSSRVQPQETILESTEECDHSTSCDNVKSQPENKVQKNHNEDDEQKSFDGISSKGSTSLIDSEDEQLDDFVML